MKFLFASTLLFLWASVTQAQFKIKKDWGYDETDNCYASKRLFVNAHYDLPFLIKKNWRSFKKKGDYITSTIGPIGVQLEYAFTKKIGLTASYSFVKSKATWSDIILDTLTQKTIALDNGFNYLAHTVSLGIHNHLFYNKYVDAFVGAEIGYSAFSYTAIQLKTELPEQHSPFHYMAYFGIRGFIMPKFAVFANLGIGDISNVKLGVVYRFGY